MLRVQVASGNKGVWVSMRGLLLRFMRIIDNVYMNLGYFVIKC